MRLIRLGALVGSVVLLVATSVSLFNKRSELREEQDARAVAAVQLAEQSAYATVDRGLAVSEVANELTQPADLVGSFREGAAACVVTATEERCSGPDLLAIPSFGEVAAVQVHTRKVIMRSDAFVAAHDQRAREFRLSSLQISKLESRDSNPQTRNWPRAVDRDCLVE